MDEIFGNKITCPQVIVRKRRDFPGGPVVRTQCFHCLPWPRVQSLVNPNPPPKKRKG